MLYKLYGYIYIYINLCENVKGGLGKRTGLTLKIIEGSRLLNGHRDQLARTAPTGVIFYVLLTVRLDIIV